MYFCFFQEISSPNFPSNYPPNINCRWVLVAPSTSKIHLHFLSMNMEGSNLCSKDSLTIADASSKIPVRHEVNSSMIVSSDRNRNHANRWFRVSSIKKFFFYHFLFDILCLWFDRNNAHSNLVQDFSEKRKGFEANKIKFGHSTKFYQIIDIR